MENVFFYFFVIGAGLTAGIGFMILPIFWIKNKMNSKRSRA